MSSLRIILVLAGLSLLLAGPGPVPAMAQGAGERLQQASEAMAGAAAKMAASAEAPVQAGTDMGLLVFVFVLAIFLGFELIARVPSQLHTPLMSGSNAISGITIVGALLAAGKGSGTMMTVLGTLAVAFAMINVVGGYLVTDRMLAMFKSGKGGGK